MTATATFTDPKTWAFHEGVESAELNTGLRDEINSMGPHLIARKSPDEADATGVLQNDDNLLLVLAANEIWQFRFTLFVVTTTAIDFQCRLTFPSGSISCLVIAANTGTALISDISTTTSPSATASMNMVNTTTNPVI